MCTVGACIDCHVNVWIGVVIAVVIGLAGVASVLYVLVKKKIIGE